jgi:hypothetical protein
MDAANRIYAQARAGTPKNPGLPDPLASLLVAQAKHETGNFTSRFFRENNNAFGYAYYPGSLYQDGGGGIADNGSPIGSYPSIEASTMEIIDWIYRRFREGRFPAPASITTPDQYAAALKSAQYFGDTLQNYLAGLKSFFTPMVAATSGAGVILAIAAILYARYRRWI